MGTGSCWSLFVGSVRSLLGLIDCSQLVFVTVSPMLRTQEF